MNKICTSVEQSKKLIELGLDVNTADMIYQPTMDIDSMSNVGFVKIPLCIPFNEVKECNIQYLPAWSLSALIELMPFHIIENNVRYEFQTVKGLNKEGGTYKIKYKSYTSLFETLMYNNPIDAAFQMACLLKENGKL